MPGWALLLADIWESLTAFSGWMCLAPGEWGILLLGKILKSPGEWTLQAREEWEFLSPVVAGTGKTPNSESIMIKLRSSDQQGKGVVIPPHFDCVSNAHESVPGPCSAWWMWEEITSVPIRSSSERCPCLIPFGQKSSFSIQHSQIHDSGRNSSRHIV